jgi:cell division protein FtsL
LPDSRLLDRLLRGRAWIVLLGVLLIGLVAINVSLLKLNSEAGRNAEKVKALRIQNTQIRAKVSRLASAERLERAGRELGMSMAVAGRVRYLSIRPQDPRQAARAIRTWQDVPTFAFAPLPAAPAPAPVMTLTPAQAVPASNAPVATQAPVADAAPAPDSTEGAQAPQGAVPAPGSTAQPPAAAPTTPSAAGGGAPTAPTG